MAFTKATKHKAKLRAALCGVSGSGKTFSALMIASHLGKRIAVIDTESGSASKYADQFTFDVDDTLPDHSPKSYIDAIQSAASAGYDVLVIDSLTHAWAGRGGALEMVDVAAAKSQGNSYAAWRTVTPWHNKLVDAILTAPLHIIATMRTKAEYVLENKNGKQVPRKVGMAPIQRDGMEYEFDVVGDLDLNHTLSVSKTRCPALDGKQFQLPGKDVAQALLKWLDAGEAAPTPKPQAALVAAKSSQPDPLLQDAPPANGNGHADAEALDAPAADDIKDKCCAMFDQIGVAVADVEAIVKRGLADWTNRDMGKLRAEYAKLKAKFDATPKETANA